MWAHSLKTANINAMYTDVRIVELQHRLMAELGMEERRDPPSNLHGNRTGAAPGSTGHRQPGMGSLNFLSIRGDSGTRSARAGVQLQCPDLTPVQQPPTISISLLPCITITHSQLSPKLHYTKDKTRLKCALYLVLQID